MRSCLSLITYEFKQFVSFGWLRVKKSITRAILLQQRSINLDKLVSHLLTTKSFSFMQENICSDHGRNRRDGVVVRASAS